MLASSPASGRSSSIPSGSSRSTPRIRPWPSTWPRGAIRPPGSSANTNCCTYETGLDRGFAHFEDYALTPRSLLSRTVPGNWILENILSLSATRYYDKKWIGLQSRGAREINAAFLDWLGRRRTDRPFFAFLNYFDAHEPYIPPPGYRGPLRDPARGPRRITEFLFDYRGDGQEPDHEAGPPDGPRLLRRLHRLPR